MNDILATLEVEPQNFPAGTAAGPYRFTISGPRNETQDIPYTGSGVSATFVDVADGVYDVTAELLDINGVRLGNQLTSQVTVTTAQGITIIVPASSGLTVQVIYS